MKRMIGIAFAALTFAAVGLAQHVNGFGMGPRWGGGMASATTSTLTVGIISPDMYEIAGKHLIWCGTATQTVDAGNKPEKRQSNIGKGLAGLLKNYPPKKT